MGIDKSSSFMYGSCTVKRPTHNSQLNTTESLMNINELQRFQGVGHNILLTCFGYSYSDIEWALELEAEHEGTKLKVRGTGPTPEDAAREAMTKWDRATSTGLPEMNPQLTYDASAEVEAAPNRPIDDEVSF